MSNSQVMSKNDSSPYSIEQNSASSSSSPRSPPTRTLAKEQEDEDEDLEDVSPDEHAYHHHHKQASTSSTAMLTANGGGGLGNGSSGELHVPTHEFHHQRDVSGAQHVASEDSGATFADEVFAPVTQWADEMRWSRKKPSVEQRRKWLLVVSYAPDWIITILLALLLALTDKAHGFRRQFSLTDTSIQHTYAVSERVPVWLLVVLALIVPIVLQGVFSLAITRSFWDFHASLLGLIVTHALAITMANILKVTVGRPRPDLIDRCQPRAGSMNAAVYGLSTDAICTNSPNDHLVTDGFRSFPSGHATTSFAGLTFLSLYLAGKLHLFSSGSKGHAVVSWIVFFPIAAAALIAVSRTMDYRHHATDVIAGGIIGFLTALGVYRLYYPSLKSAWSHKPLAPRIARRRNQQDVEECPEAASLELNGHGETRADGQNGVRI